MPASRILIAACGLFALAACQTAEERFASDSNKLFSSENPDFAKMCGAIAEIAIERSPAHGDAKASAHVQRAWITGQGDDFVEAAARLRLTASGYLAGHHTVECRFDSTEPMAGQWYRLEAMQWGSEPLEEDGIDGLNALGIALAGYQDEA